MLACALLLTGLSAQAAVNGQGWFQPNLDSSLGLFDALALHYVSQTPAQSGFVDVVLGNSPGWASLGFDPQLTYFVGEQGKSVSYAVYFEGQPTDQVQWEVWYFHGPEALGGFRYVGDLPHNAYLWQALSALDSPASPVPEPQGYLLAPLALGLLGWQLRRRAASCLVVCR